MSRKQLNTSFVADPSMNDQQLLQQVVMFYHERLQQTPKALEEWFGVRASLTISVDSASGFC